MTPLRHYSNAELLELLDGEASLVKSAMIRNHLQNCWPCRARLLEVEQQIQTAARTFGADGLPGAGRLEFGRLEFLKHVADYEAASSPALQLSRRNLSFMPLALAAASLAAILFVAHFRPSTPVSPVAPAEAAVLSARADDVPSSQILYQEFLIDLQQTPPKALAAHTRMKLRSWSDPAQRQFASRLEDESGRLHLGLWRDSGGSFVYRDSAAGRASLRRISAPTNSPAMDSAPHRQSDSNDLLSRVMDWLEYRDWQGFRLAMEIPVPRQERVAWTGAQVVERHGNRVLLLTSTRQAGPARITISVEIDPQTYRARLQRVQIEMSGDIADIRVTALDRQALNRAAVALAVFHPDSGLAHRASATRLSQSAAEVAIAPHPTDLDSLEAEVTFAVHTVHADLGEPVSIVRTGNRLRVEGLLDSVDRKQQIQSALEHLTAGPELQLDLSTVEEASQRAARSGSGSTGVVFNPIDPPALAAGRQVDSIRDALKKELQRQSGLQPSEVNERVVEIGNRAVALSSENMQAAWALRRLAERFPPARLARLQPQARSLVESDVHDLNALMRTDCGALRHTLDPLLRSLAPERSDADSAANNPGAGVGAQFFYSSKIRDLIHSVFAGRSLGPESHLDMTAPRRVVQELLSLLDELDQSLEVAGRDFTTSGSNGLAAATREGEKP